MLQSGYLVPQNGEILLKVAVENVMSDKGPLQSLYMMKDTHLYKVV